MLFLHNVRALPKALAGFLALLGAAALAHASMLTARRRRQDFAVLKALGFRPRQNAACICWQAVTIAVVGLTLGVPAGAVIGRLTWHWVADSTPLVYVPPLAAAAIGLAAPVSLLTAIFLAALPARQAARTSTKVLRSE